MLSVVYKNRALPLAWLVAEGSRGHFSQDCHLTLIRQVKEIVPEVADVMFLGDGEFDGIQLQAEIESYRWKYVCRTALDTWTQNSQTLTFEKLLVCRGERITFTTW